MKEESGRLKRNSKPLIVKIVLVLVPVVRKLLEFINRGAVLFLLTCKEGVWSLHLTWMVIYLLHCRKWLGLLNNY